MFECSAGFFNRGLGGLQRLNCGVCVGVGGKVLGWWKPQSCCYKQLLVAEACSRHTQQRPAAPPGCSTRPDAQIPAAESQKPAAASSIHTPTHTHTQQQHTQQEERFQSQNNIYLFHSFKNTAQYKYYKIEYFLCVNILGS